MIATASANTSATRFTQTKYSRSNVNPMAPNTEVSAGRHNLLTRKADIVASVSNRILCRKAILSNNAQPAAPRTRFSKDRGSAFHALELTLVLRATLGPGTHLVRPFFVPSTVVESVHNGARQMALRRISASLYARLGSCAGTIPRRKDPH